MDSIESLEFLVAGYAAFFALLAGYIVRLVRMGRNLERERRRLERLGDGDPS